MTEVGGNPGAGGNCCCLAALENSFFEISWSNYSVFKWNNIQIQEKSKKSKKHSTQIPSDDSSQLFPFGPVIFLDDFFIFFYYLFIFGCCCLFFVIVLPFEISWAAKDLAQAFQCNSGYFFCCLDCVVLVIELKPSTIVRIVNENLPFFFLRSQISSRFGLAAFCLETRSKSPVFII